VYSFTKKQGNLDMAVFSVKSLCKSYRVSKRPKGFWKGISEVLLRQHDIKVALDHISFDIEEGEIVGYIGPNGAGKSTTVKILSGILVPDKGEVNVLGKTPWKNRIEIVRQIGVVFGQRTQLWWDLDVIESFKLLKSIYSIPDHEYKNKLIELLDALQLEKLLTIPVRQLSLGQRMRCDLAASLLHSPKILFLDEPTIGLDVISKIAVRNFIQQLNQDKKVTILLTTHDMDDIEFLCRRVLILNQGKIDFDGSMEHLKSKMIPERRVVIELLKANESIEESYLHLIKKEGNRLWMSFNSSRITAPELVAQITSKYAVVDLLVENPPIEETIAKLYQKPS
jgi:ABC-2 type transport system ATP-binding protein